MVHLQNTYPGLLAAVEVWNEPDGQWPIPEADMVALVAAVRTAMNAQPKLAGVPLAAPATVTGEGTYWQTLVTNQLLTHVNWVSHHMYSDPHMLERRVANLRDETSAGHAANLRQRVRRQLDHCDAHELAGTLTMLKALGIHAASHFTLQDYGTAFADRGLLNSTGLIGEQGTVWKTWHGTIGVAATFGAREIIGTLSNVRCYRFTRSGATIRVVWASLGTPSILVSGGTYTAKDAFGTAITAGGTHILGPSPIYITGNSLTVAPAGTPGDAARLPGDRLLLHDPGAERVAIPVALRLNLHERRSRLG